MSKFCYILITSHYAIKLYRSVVTPYTYCFMFTSLQAAYRFYTWVAFGSLEEGHTLSEFIKILSYVKPHGVFCWKSRMSD
jgi:hypothetical protein